MARKVMNLDRWLILVSFLIGILTILCGLYEFDKNSKQRLYEFDKSSKQRLDEFELANSLSFEQFNQTTVWQAKSPFYVEQLDIYTEIVDIVGKMATAGDLGKEGDLNYYGTQTERFWAMYYGKMALVEDENVASVMIEIGKLITKNDGKNVAGGDPIKNLALKLSAACRKSIEQSWKIKPIELKLKTFEKTAKDEKTSK